MGCGWSVSDMPSQVGKTVIVTGANSGIGYVAARELARAGAAVILACRSAERAQEALRTLRATCPDGSFEVLQLDVASLPSVRAFAAEFLARGVALDTLINNAGIMMTPTRELTADGFEGQFATNHIGHFALTGLLLPALTKSAAPRVVSISSMKARGGNFDGGVDFVMTPESYNSGAVYNQTKLANLLFINELSVRHPEVLAVAAHPGFTKSNLFDHAYNDCCTQCFAQPTASGANPMLRAATEEGLGPRAYMAPQHDMRGAAVPIPMPALACNQPWQAQLWAASVAATGVDY
jgi:NAD(P)-dependent dehydrogenase (short-subunit alcohol dehydrogenase family)